ncbi:polyprenyl synthetase family protein [Candidatus Pelagibacter sp.]|jgi:farnesyl diphosphate synthase|nr:polyprenyl synthetase family protein [Candidatus Pelagibacter sp.]MDC0346561.1 polyprenyl synthetase family protein [Candidatus Pelagibacter sp.]MDC1247898.1 polyprenyl synthetase family protein [Pelagibacteraceae bacterium]
MRNKLKEIAKDTNIFLQKFITKQQKTELIPAMKYGLFPGGKKIRSKILLDIGSIFKIKYQTLIAIGAAVECIHAYSLIHDDLPCMDNDTLRRGKPSTHIKFGEATAVLAGNSLLTMAFEILSSSYLRISEKSKLSLIKRLSECSGHLGIAGGQYLDLNFEKKKVSKNKIINMEVKKTGKLFSFCCSVAPIIKNRSAKEINFFDKIGSNVGLLFQIADDVIDYQGSSKVAGKKTGKDKKKGKATLISLLGYKNAIKYSENIKFKIISDLDRHNFKSNNLNETLNYILKRNK